MEADPFSISMNAHPNSLLEPVNKHMLGAPPHAPIYHCILLLGLLNAES